jgi:hypothetical protein
VINAQVAAQLLGFVWLAIGVVVLMVFVLTGRRPRLVTEPTAAADTTEEPR